MSKFDSSLNLIDPVPILEPVSDQSISDHESGEKNIIISDPLIQNRNNLSPFDIKFFANELRDKSERENKNRFKNSGHITAYSIAHDCILSVVKRLLNYPVQTFSSIWLPIYMRSEIGKAIHQFIQSNTSQFTEIERSLNVPSIRFSGIVDAFIGQNILVEIKSCTYEDYAKIIKTKKPRLNDFYQIMTYKYMLDNHFSELKNPGVKTRTDVPSYNSYNIKYLQFIYIAHDIIASDVNSMGEAIKIVKNVKKLLTSARNKFFFMTSLVLDTDTFDETVYTTAIKKKIEAINYYVDNNKLPCDDDEFIDKSACFFCIYRRNCELLKKNKR